MAGVALRCCGFALSIAFVGPHPGAAGQAGAGQPAPPPITKPDCSRLKGKDRSACDAQVKSEAAPASPSAKDARDAFPFPEEQSKKGGELQHGTGDMPTSGVPDPPSSSLKPSDVDSLPGAPGTGRSPNGAGASAPSGASSSSADSALPTPADSDDDVAPTRAGGDSPVKSSSLRDLGSRGETSQARAKLEQTRVEDDLRVGGYYYKDGNLPGAQARYQDALQHDPDNPDAHFGLAQVLLKQSKRDEAVSHLQRYVQLAPDDDHTKEAQKLLARLQARK